MSAQQHAMVEADELAALTFYTATAARLGHDWGNALSAIAQAKPAQVASLVDALLSACPDCGAQPSEECHPDCSSRWEVGE